MAALMCRVGRGITRISLRSVVVIPSNARPFATQDTVTHTGQVNTVFTLSMLEEFQTRNSELG